MTETLEADRQVSEKARPGKKPTPPGHVKVFKTAIFKVHNPSQHKRAMLRDAMKRAHLAYDRLLNAFLPDAAEIDRLLALPKNHRRREIQALSGRAERRPFSCWTET